MSGQQQRPAMTASQITYTNTIADAVRMLVDQYHTLGPAQATVGNMLTSVATAWMEEQATQNYMPTDSFNMLASPATCRVATTQMMRSIANQTIAREVSFSINDSQAQQAAGEKALALIEDTMLRLITNTGMRDERAGPLTETREYQRAYNIVNAELHRQGKHVGAGSDDGYASWWQNLDPKLLEPEAGSDARRAMSISISDTPQLRQSLLAESMSNTMEWAVTQAFRMAVRGENTAGRLLAAFEIPMTNQHIEFNSPTVMPKARSLRELQLTIRVLADELQQPGGMLNTMALDFHQFQLQRLGLQPAMMAADAFVAATQPALNYAAKVGDVLTRVVEQNDGWARSGTNTTVGRTSFIISAPNSLQ